MAFIPNLREIQIQLNLQLRYIYNTYGTIAKVIYENTNQYNNIDFTISNFSPDTDFLIEAVKSLHGSKISNLTYQVVSDLLSNFGNYIEYSIYYMRINNVDSQFLDIILKYKEAIVTLANYATDCLEQNNLITYIYVTPSRMSFREVLFRNNKDISTDYQANLSLNPSLVNSMAIPSFTNIRLYRSQ